MAINGTNQENVQDHLVNGIPSEEGEGKDGEQLLEQPKNQFPGRHKHVRPNKDDGMDLVSGRKAQEERHG